MRCAVDLDATDAWSGARAERAFAESLEHLAAFDKRPQLIQLRARKVRRLQPAAGVEQLLQPERDRLCLVERGLVELRLRAGGFTSGVDVRIDIENDVVRIVQNRAVQRFGRPLLMQRACSAMIRCRSVVC